MKKQRFVIIDSNALIHRAFHALPPTMSNKHGQVTNAVFGFTSILIKAINDLKPDYIVATFDLPGGTFRHKEFAEYKAGRQKPPQELYDQIPIVKEVLQSFNIPIFEKTGFEADDLIATVSRLKSVDNPNMESVIVTGDQDIMQLVDGNTKVFSPKKGISETILYDEKLVTEKFDGITPKQLIDYKALRGDPSDNIPGVKGIGHKGAVDLLLAFNDLDGIYKNIDSPKITDRTRTLLTEHQTEAYLSKKLVTLIDDVPVKFDLEKCRLAGFDKNRVVELFQELNFKRLLGQLGTLDAKLVAKGGQSSLFEHTSSPLSQGGGREGVSNKKQNYILVNKNNLEKFLKDLKKQREFCFDTETTGLNPFDCELVGISFCWSKGMAHYLPAKLFKTAKNDLVKIFSNPKIKKIGHNIKFDIEVLREAGIETLGIYFDTMLASYLLSPGSRQHSLDTLAFTELGYQMQPITELIGTGKDAISLKGVAVEKVCWYSCEDADITWQLYQNLESQLTKQNMTGLFSEIDMALVSVLATIEKNGVKIDEKKLKAQSKKITKEIKEIEKEVQRLCKTEFNLASPKQLKEILFTKLKIDSLGLKKTKTGISTAAGELEKLAGKHLAIDLVLRFRELSKLKNTYLDALPKLINKNDDRVHTSYNQAITATGRLSSSDPNLQNIPVRTKLGRQIREAFVAEKGFKILKADYSQIELRIIASLANDKIMLDAFERKVDIHTQTAAIINEIDVEEVDKELRRQAKEVNFGVLYGMGAWGLSQRTGISGKRAQEFIDKYFQNFKQVKKYIDETIKLAEETGYVETFYGRRRYLPEINSGIAQVRNTAERMAVNAPIQGTAADLIKLAMIEIDKKLPKVSPEAKMILQVHDELVFEVPERDVEKVAKLVKEEMNGVYKLRAPIETEVSVGDDWEDTTVIKL